MTWDELYAFVFAAPPTSSVFNAIEKGWDTNSYLLAGVIDALQINNWQRTEGAHRKPPTGMPKPIPRPGDEPADKPAGDTVSVGFGTVATVTTVAEFMAMREKRFAKWRKRHRRERP